LLKNGPAYRRQASAAFLSNLNEMIFSTIFPLSKLSFALHNWRRIRKERIDPHRQREEIRVILLQMFHIEQPLVNEKLSEPKRITPRKMIREIFKRNLTASIPFLSYQLRINDLIHLVVVSSSTL